MTILVDMICPTFAFKTLPDSGKVIDSITLIKKLYNFKTQNANFYSYEQPSTLRIYETVCLGRDFQKTKIHSPLRGVFQANAN
jgi:hypothetical protein